MSECRLADAAKYYLKNPEKSFGRRWGYEPYKFDLELSDRLSRVYPLEAVKILRRLVGESICGDMPDYECARHALLLLIQCLFVLGKASEWDNLDQAIVRRFTFKLQFDYLDEAGKRLFFERMFKTKLTDADAAQLAEVRNLAPGDFRTVRQSMYYLGGEVTNAQRIAELAKESSVKRDTKKAGRIGF